MLNPSEAVSDFHFPCKAANVIVQKTSEGNKCGGESMSIHIERCASTFAQSVRARGWARGAMGRACKALPAWVHHTRLSIVSFPCRFESPQKRVSNAMTKIGGCSMRGLRCVLARNLFVFVTILFVASIVYFYIDIPLRLTVPIFEDGSDFQDEDFYNDEFTMPPTESTPSFNKSSNDVLVFVHIQKTAGTTFEKFLVRYQESLPCKCMAHKKRCNCGRNSSNETWLFSRYSTGWVCGLHADYTELVVNNCVQRVLDKQAGHKKKRNYFYTTFLRNPTDRFISEFRHVQRGATWISSKHVCDGKPASVNDLPTCFDPRIGWEGVTLEEFISCPYNLAFNRQTRMLANLSLVGCYEHLRRPSYEQDKIMMESAKENLRKMAFFGIKERMDDSQFYFENTFNMKFTRKMSVWGKSKSNDTVLSESQLAYIRNVNKLDWELYEYAVQLFDERVNHLQEKNRIRR